MNDYNFWRIVCKILPLSCADLIFTIYTAIQLYILGAIYVVKEIQRKVSSKIRKLGPHEPDIPDDLSGYVTIVTGGSRGIGLSVSRDLYRRGATVIVTSSAGSENELKQISAEITEDVPKSNGAVVVWPIDFRHMNSVCEFVARFNREYKTLDILVNNAGVMFVDRAYTVDGYEYHYQINYLAHVLLTWLLMPALSRSPHQARVVNVSSSTHYPRPAFLDDLQSRHTPYSPFHAYAQSKLCQIMFTYHVAELLKHSKQYNRVLINSLHPGVAKTGLYQHVWWVKMFPRIAGLLFRVSSLFSSLLCFFLLFLLSFVSISLLFLAFPTAEEGAETIIYCGLSTEIESGGHYFEDCATVKSSKYSRITKAQKRLGSLTCEQLREIIAEFRKQYPDSGVTELFQ